MGHRGGKGLILMWHSSGAAQEPPCDPSLAVGWGTLSMMILLAFGEGLKQAIAEGRPLSAEADLVILWAGSTTKAVARNEAGTRRSVPGTRTSRR